MCLVIMVSPFASGTCAATSRPACGTSALAAPASPAGMPAAPSAGALCAAQDKPRWPLTLPSCPRP